MSYHECPTCEGQETVCAKCGVARIPKRYQRHLSTFRHDDHLSAKIIRCPEHQTPWYNCDCCGKEHVDGARYLWAKYVFPRLLGNEEAQRHIGYCGDCASFIRARLEVAFDEAVAQVSK